MSQIGHNGGPALPSWVDYTFDVESLPNIFTAVFCHVESGTEWIFEVSDRKNQSVQFLQFVRTLGMFDQCRMVGFNSIGYDYPLIHHLLNFHSFTAADAYAKSKQIINTPWNDRNKNVIWENDRHVRQVDLFKVHHFDNVARRTSLKQLEIALQLPCVIEYQVDWDAPLPVDRIPSLIAYNRHDVHATTLFYLESRKQLEFRDQMTAELGRDMTNQSDSNIGKEVFIKGLEDAQPGICGRRGAWRQTPRSVIRLGECVFPYVQFQTHPFNKVLQYFRERSITQTKDAFKLEVENFGMVWKFGTGGIHAAKDGVTWRSSNSRAIQARDVKSYYPNLAIRNRVFPEHLSETFCVIYEKLYDERAATPKKDPKNGALKLALNGTYGNSNSKFSPFYDPKYTMTITINGQLLLCMLAEWLDQIPTLELIQANTDGIMYAVDVEYIPMCDEVSRRWEQLTALVLETDDFNLFAQRDVNNYLARDTGGKLKSKGAFEYQHGLHSHGYEERGDGGNWHKNQSAKIIAMAAEAFLCEGVPVEETVNGCDDPFLFMTTLKIQKTDRVVLGGELGKYVDTASPVDDKGRHPERTLHTGGVDQQHVGRYYIAHRGEPLFKIMAPLKKLPHHYRPQAIEKGHLVAMCNDLYHFDWNNLNRGYYIDAARELLINTGVNP